jgi:hypothetical protein
VVESGGLIQVISVDIVVERHIHCVSGIGGGFRIGCRAQGSRRCMIGSRMR